jgi:hypothetical protein
VLLPVTIDIQPSPRSLFPNATLIFSNGSALFCSRFSGKPCRLNAFRTLRAKTPGVGVSNDAFQFHVRLSRTNMDTIKAIGAVQLP